MALAVSLPPVLCCDPLRHPTIRLPLPVLAHTHAIPSPAHVPQNHTARNRTFKAHKNGIKKEKKKRFMPMAGVDPKFLRNLRFSKKKNKKTPKANKA